MARGKHSKKNKKTYRLIQFLLIIVIIVAVIYIYKYIVDKSNAQKETELLNYIEVDKTEVTKQKTERMLQVSELKKENEEIVGWIEIEGTKVNNPVLQGTDNSFYMNHDYKKKESVYGSLFLDKSYDWNKPSSNLLIYGHNMRDGSMFQNLLNYREEDYYKKHPIIRFTTEDEDAEFEVMAAFQSRVYYKSEKNVFRYYYFIDANNEEEYNEFVNNAKKASFYDTGVTAEYGDQLITLSTCSYHTEDGRFVVVGKKKDKN